MTALSLLVCGSRSTQATVFSTLAEKEAYLTSLRSSGYRAPQKFSSGVSTAGLEMTDGELFTGLLFVVLGLFVVIHFNFCLHSDFMKTV